MFARTDSARPSTAKDGAGGSEFGAIQNHAPATLVAFAHHFAAALHARRAADRTYDFIRFLLFIPLAMSGKLDRII
jgi:hypothetical protein